MTANELSRGRRDLQRQLSVQTIGPASEYPFIYDLPIPKKNRDSNERAPFGQQPDLKREDLLQALGIAAEYLNSKNVHYEIITVGGAVSTIHLQFRESTPAMDFFISAGFGVQDTKIMGQAVDHAVKQMGRNRLGDTWLNNRVVELLSPDEWEKLVRLAKQQNTTVFQARGLRVLAAPWSYSFITKAALLMRDDAKSYEWYDAVQYLRQYILMHGNQPVTRDVVNRWAGEYRRLSVEPVLPIINGIYRLEFNTNAVKNL